MPTSPVTHPCDYMLCTSCKARCEKQQKSQCLLRLEKSSSYSTRSGIIAHLTLSVEQTKHEYTKEYIAGLDPLVSQAGYKLDFTAMI